MFMLNGNDYGFVHVLPPIHKEELILRVESGNCNLFHESRFQDISTMFAFIGVILACHCGNIPMQLNSIFHGSLNSIFQMNICDIFHIYGPNIDHRCLLESPRWGGSNKYPQSIFWEKKKNEYPCKPQIFLYKLGFEELLIACALT